MLTKDKGFYRSFIRLCLTLMLQQAVVLSVNLADNLMLGTYSEAALSGVAAVNQIQFVYQQLVYAAGTAMIVLGSQYFGKGQLSQVRKLSAIGVAAALLIGAVLFALVSLFPRQALFLFTEDPQIADQGVRYLKLIRFSYLFFAASTVMLSTMRIAQSVKIALRVSVIALIINVSINYLLIGGNLGFPEMGVEGAAIGTVAARIAEFFIISRHLFTKEKQLDLHPRDYLHIDWSMLRDYVRVGTPVMINEAAWGFSNALQTMILGHMSASAIAAQSISSTVFQLLKVTAVGAASAASILIGQTIGEGRLDKVREYTRTLQVIFVGIGCTLAVLMLLIRLPLLAVYQVSDETRTLANAYMLIQSAVLLTASYQMPVNTGIIRGGGDTRYVMILDLVSIWGIVVPVSLLAAFVWKLSPVWVIIFLNADQFFKCIPAFIRVNRYHWIKKLTREG